MSKSGQDNKVSFNHLIKECVLAGEWDKASEAITRMVHQGKGGRGVRFDHNTFNAVSEVRGSLPIFLVVKGSWFRLIPILKPHYTLPFPTYLADYIICTRVFGPFFSVFSDVVA